MKMNMTWLLVITFILGITVAGIELEPWYIDMIVVLIIIIPFYHVMEHRYKVIRI